jgi:hypothetical protein
MNKKLLDIWSSKWEEALFIWSKYVKLSTPVFCFTKEEETRNHLGSSFAMINLETKSVVVSLRLIEEFKLEDYSVEILSHEIGHHIYCPADLTDHARMIARIRRALPRVEQNAPFVSNLYSDLLINNKLKREYSLRIDEVYKKIANGKTDSLWTFYMRTYEILWGLEKGSIAIGELNDSIEGDAQIANRLIRNYSRDWVNGSGKFALICYPYLLENKAEVSKAIMRPLMDQNSENTTNLPIGLTEIDSDEIDSIKLSEDDTIGKSIKNVKENPPSRGQAREPFEYGEILKALGINLTKDEMKYRYYKERALPYLIPFPTKKTPESKELILEGTDTWDIGSPIENIDWFQTAMKSTIIIPGYTTVEQVYGLDKGKEPEKEPIDLDIYIDCSGSMPDPGYSTSYLALAGTIICLSALRVGSKIQATLWSGAKEFITTDGFISDERKILQIVNGYLGGATAFPIHILRDTYSKRKPSSRKVHILVISDDGVTTIYDKDEKGNLGFDVLQKAIDASGTGVSFVLNLYSEWTKNPGLVKANSQGVKISVVKNWNDLIDFAKDFSERNYGDS